MAEIRKMKAEDLENVADFISVYNNMERSHIGFCGKEKQSIANSLAEDLEVPYTEWNRIEERGLAGS